MNTPVENLRTRWAHAWPDMVGCGIGLAMAWHFQWRTTDLVWSLWLSSLVVGYLTIIWHLCVPAWRLRQAARPGAAMVAVTGGAVMLIFFTFHFGLFHLVHALFLRTFFPLTGTGQGFFSLSAVGEVVHRYWWFVPVALLAEREGFRLLSPPPASRGTDDRPAAAVALQGIAGGGGLMRPYANVVRLHLLIFFFAAVHFLGLESFAVYAVVYAVYFFPWRLLGLPRFSNS